MPRSEVELCLSEGLSYAIGLIKQIVSWLNWREPTQVVTGSYTALFAGYLTHLAQGALFQVVLRTLLQVLSSCRVECCPECFVFFEAPQDPVVLMVCFYLQACCWWIYACLSWPAAHGLTI
jgi:hypothetical protein